MSQSNLESDFFVHHLAVCDSDHIGKGTRIWAFSHVMKNARIGADCNLGENVFVESSAHIGDRCTIKNGVALWDLVHLESDVFVGPSVVFTNDLTPRAFIRRGSTHWLPTRIERGATLGANSTIVCGVTIGAFALVGAGSVVTRSLPPHAFAVGNPARVIGVACFCGVRLNKQSFCERCKAPLAENSPETAAHRQSASPLDNAPGR